MDQKGMDVSEKLQRQILEHCRHLAGAYQILSICQSSDYPIQKPSARSTIEVLLILKNFPARLISNVRQVEGRNVVFFVVDQWIFERDVDRGFLGEALASILIFPYTIVFGKEFLQNQEIILKKRLILELLENLVLTYPELSHSIQIKPEYFMFEVMLNRVRAFPPMAYGASQFLCGDAGKEQVETVLSGYTEALRQLKQAGIIDSSDGYVILSAKFIEKSNDPRVRFSNILKNAPRALFTSLFGAFPQLLNFLAQNSEAFFQFQTPPWKKEFHFSKNFEDPQKFVFVPTSQGLVSLADRADIKEFARRVLKIGESDKIKIERFGGVLNDVFLIKAYRKDAETKILAKRFRDLHSMKWFPLTMWSVGARSFALLGRSRLERETAINAALKNAGFHVPKILHVSAGERLVFMEFIEGENASAAIKRIASSRNTDEVAKDIAVIKQIGETYAKVHALNIVLGDTKPENSMIDREGNLCLLDLEQSSRNGDRSWDVACFLYYCGHYLPLNGERKAEMITKAFIKGYLSAGGEPEVIKCAGITRFTRVFSIFTLPSILRTMANTCKRTEGPSCKRL